MPLKALDAGTLRTARFLTAKAGGLDRRVRTAKVFDGSTLRTVAVFADPLTVTISPAEVSGTQGSNDPIPVTTNQASASPAGGLPPYSYAWTRVSGGVGAADTPAMASTFFTATIGPGSATSTFRVTVTDSGGAPATADVVAEFNNVGGGGLEP